MVRLNEGGQFIPISAMVIFSTVVFLVAVVDIYRVSAAKLKVQNLADAVALNIASQMAGSMNKVADLNEWMNHMVDPGPNGVQSTPGQAIDCTHLNPKLLPPISCAENKTKSSKLFMFGAKGDAAAYAVLVQKINQTQQLFIDTYNNFLGAGTATSSSISSKSSLHAILLADIPELGDAGTTVFVWNYKGGMPTAQNVQFAVSQNAGAKAGTLNSAGMRPLAFKVHDDIMVTFKTEIPLVNVPGPPQTKTLSNLVSSKNKAANPIGWMEPDPLINPQIQVGFGTGGKTRIGAGAKVVRSLRVPVLGTITLSAQSQAYVVQDSGTMGIDPKIDPLRPVFKPTYWVKLVGAN